MSAVDLAWLKSAVVCAAGYLTPEGYGALCHLSPGHEGPHGPRPGES